MIQLQISNKLKINRNKSVYTLLITDFSDCNF